VQENHYPGATGVESLDLGGVGGVTHCTGWLLSPTLQGLAGAEQAFRAYQQDGGAYVLFDTRGNLWTNVILKTFEPHHPVEAACFSQGLGPLFGVYYTATFRHLV
jgi:hypothetical protein